MKSFMLKAISISFCLIIFSSCQKDEEGFIPDQSTESQFDIFGVISTENNEPIEGATVTFKGMTTQSDADGVYNFKNVQVGSQHNFVKIEKVGYFECARTFRAANFGIQYQRSILQEKVFDYEFQATNSFLLESEIATVSFPSNSIVIEDSGAEYSGLVQVALREIDPSLSRLTELMPGDMTAMGTDDELLTLKSFGMVNVEMQAPDGRKLQIAPAAQVELSYTIHESLLTEAPSTIDLWYFDYDTGVWIQEGEATLMGDKYVGMVSHFSCWNYDVSAPSVVVSGRIKVDDYNLNYFRVEILNSNSSGGRGWTDGNGYFSGRVEADSELILTVYPSGSCNNGEYVHQETIGPFDIDTELGTILVSELELSFLFFRTTAVDCDLNLVQDGRAYIGGSVFPVVDGLIDVTYSGCSGNSLDIRILNKASLRQTVVNDIPLPGETVIPQVVVCDEKADHVILDNFFASSYSAVDQIGLFLVNPSGTGITTGILDVQDRDTPLELAVVFPFDNGVSILEERTYDLTGFTLRNGGVIPNFNEVYEIDTDSGQSGTITIESISPLSDSTKLARGTFTSEVTEETTRETKTLTGSFKLDYWTF